MKTRNVISSRCSRARLIVQDPQPAPRPFPSNKSGARSERWSYPVPEAGNWLPGAGPGESGLSYRTQESTVRSHAVIPALHIPEGEKGTLDGQMGLRRQAFAPANGRVTALVALKHSGKQWYTTRWRVGENPNLPVPSAL